MSMELRVSADPRILAAIDELTTLIRVHYPDASFDVFRGEDPDGVYLRATVDMDDSEQVIEVVLDKLYEIQVERALPVHVVTTQPLARVAAQLAARGARAS
jgi:hypothetical protein